MGLWSVPHRGWSPELSCPITQVLRLSEIDRVSRRVSDLIDQISQSASREAGLANVVAQNIQHIFAVTEQTGEGTKVTAGQVRELSRMAEELRQSVSRFKIS